jgi:hypothetical protein
MIPEIHVYSHINERTEISGNHKEAMVFDNGIVEVTGSIPVGSTNQMKGLAGDG